MECMSVLSVRVWVCVLVCACLCVLKDVTIGRFQAELKQRLSGLHTGANIVKTLFLWRSDYWFSSSAADMLAV